MFDNINFAMEYQLSHTTTDVLKKIPEISDVFLSDSDRLLIKNIAFDITGYISVIPERPIQDVSKQHFCYLQAFSYKKMLSRYYLEFDSPGTILLIYTYSGKGNAHINKQDFELVPNSLFITNCCNRLSLQIDGDSWEHSELRISGGNIGYIFSEHIKENLVLYFGANNRYQAKLEQLLKTNESLTFNRQIYVNEKIMILISYILEEMGKSNIKRVIPDAISNLISYIDNNYEKKITLDDMSYYCGISKYHLVREFKKYTGFAPHAYMNELRIAKAKILLKETSLPSYVIGQMVGIDNEVNLIKLFKSKVGCTPGEFRE